MKQKIYDPTLINSIRNRAANYEKYISPQVSVPEYSHEMANPSGELFTPDEYTMLDHISNAFYDWNFTRNDTNKDTNLGEYIMANEDYNTLLGVKEYIQARQKVEELLSSPGSSRQEYDSLVSIMQQYSDDYQKALDNNLNIEPVSKLISVQLQDDKLDQALSTIEKETTPIIRPGKSQITDKDNIANTRILSLIDAESYRDNANYWESKLNSSYYNKKKEQPGMDLTDIDTYLYKLPGLMGSSSSSLGAQILGTVGAAIASSKAGGPVGSILGAAESITANVYSRDQESKAEVYQNYKSRLQELADKQGISKKVIQDAQDKMRESGKYSEEQILDTDYVYDQLITGNIISNVEKFRQLQLNSLEGIKSLYTDNMALSVSDIAQQTIEVMPLGKIATSARGLKKLNKLTKGADVIANKYGNLKEQVADRIDDIVSFGIDNVKKIPNKTARKGLIDLGGRVVLSSILEGQEEGVQYIKGQRFINNEFDPNPNVIKSFIKNIGTGSRAVFAAITPWDPVYSDDEEFMENFKGGAILGGLTTSVVGGMTTIKPLSDQIAADKFVAALYSDKIQAKDRVRKNIQYGQYVRSGNWDNVMQAFDNITDSNIQGLDTQFIEEERNKANSIRNKYTSKHNLFMAKVLGLDTRSTEYDTFIALTDYYEDLVKQNKEKLKSAEADAEYILYSPDSTDYIDNLSSKIGISSIDLRQAISNKSMLNALLSLEEDFKDAGEKLRQLENNVGIKTSRTDVVKLQHLLSRKIQQLDKQSKEFQDILQKNNITDEQLEIPSVHQDLTDAYEKLIFSQLDLERSELELQSMSDRKEAIRKIDMYTKSENRESDYVQRLDDFYRGVEETNVEENKDVTIPSIVVPYVEPTQQNQEEEISQETQQEEIQQQEEPEDISNIRKRAKDIQNEFFNEERDSKGNNKLVLKTDNEFGKTYKEASNLLEQLYYKVFPKSKKYNEFSASSKLQNYDNEYSDSWNLIQNLKNRLEESIYESGNSQQTRDILNSLKNEIENAKKNIMSTVQEQELENNADEQLNNINDKLQQVQQQQEERVPKKTVEDKTISPLEEEPKDTPATVTSILGEWIGESYQSALNQAQRSQQQEQEQISTIHEELINEALNYDNRIDPFSHRAGYELTKVIQNQNGQYVRVPIKYQGMEDYLNNDEFGEITTNEDFVTEVTKNGVQIVVKPYTDNAGKTSEAIYVLFNYKDKKYISAISTLYGLQNDYGFQELSKDRQDVVLSNLNKLRQKILELNKQIGNDQNLAIVPTRVNVTNGKIINEKNPDGSPNNRPLIQSRWLKIKDPYQINPQNTKVGISTGPLGNQTIRLQDSLLSSRGKTMGQAVLYTNVDRPDGTSERIGIKLNPANFQNDPEIAELILDLVTSNQQFFVDASGNTTPLTPTQLLSFIVNYGPQTVTNPNDDRLTRQQLKNRLAKQFFTDSDGNIIIGSATYTVDQLLNDKVLRQQAKQYIMDNFHWNLDEDGLSKTWLGGDSQSKVIDLHFSGIVPFLKNSSVDKLVVIPNKLEFTLKDFGLIKDQNGNKVVDQDYPNGISMLGWYIKQNILLTDASDRLKNALIYIADVKIQDKKSVTQQKIAAKQAAKVGKKGVRDKVFDFEDASGESHQVKLSDIFSILDGDKRKGPNMAFSNYTSPLYTNTIDKIGARKWLEKTLGIDTNVQILDSIIDVTSSGMQVVGRVTEDSILLYKDAPSGTQYHEAWHRVSQLLISEKQRRKLYDRYNKRKRTQLNDQQIDEILAEDFRQFMLYAETDDGLFKYNFETKNWFRKIFNFIKLWVRTGQYGLARLYNAINTGKFAGIKPDQDNISRFRNIYQSSGPNLEVYGYKFNHITTWKQIDDITKSLMYVFFQTDFANDSIDYSSLSKNTPDFSTLKRILTNSADEMNSPVFDEIIEKFDQVFVPLISIRLKDLGIRAIDRNENDTISKIEEGEDTVNIGQHTTEGINISIKDNAPAEVKFFFQTIPQLKRDTNGKLIAVLDPYTNFPKFVDSKKAWDKILLDLAGSRTISNMVEKIAHLADTDTFYAALLDKFNKLITQSVSDDPNISINAEAMLTKIEVVVTSDVNNLVTAKIDKDENGFTSMKITNNTVDIKAQRYPKVWSQALFHNSGLFKYNDKGIIVVEDGAKDTIKELQKNIKRLITAFVNNKGILRANDKDVDLHQPANQEILKDVLVRLFQRVGILIDKPTINKMLQSGDYGDPYSDQYSLLDSFITSKVNYGGISKLSSLLDNIYKSIKSDGTIPEVNIGDKVVRPDNLLSDIGFVKVLANYYSYVHSTDKGLNSLGPDGNSYYMVSQNNFVKDRISELNEDKQLLNDLNSVVYNQGSLLLRAANERNRLQVETFINFKDNTTYDTGRDYFNITDREDYLAKMAAVFSDRIIFPTVADKKTYHFITGVKLPHERVKFYQNGDGKIAVYGDESLDTILNYCYSELNAIELCLRQIDDDPSHYRNGIHYNEDGSINEDWLEPSRRIKNYHTENKGKGVSVEGNGARFRFLIGIYTSEGFVSFNDPKKTAKQNLQTAKDYFFNLSKDSQKVFLSGIISQRVKEEVKTAKSLGLITANDNNDIWSIRNVLLDDEQILNRMKSYNAVDSINAEGYAIWDMLADYTMNSIISVNEVERVFSGDPAFYKIKYNTVGITDISVDKIKRLGALTSTGTNNRLDFFNDFMRSEYTVAELKDHEIQSKQYYIYEELFTRGNIKETIQELEGEEAWESVKDLDINEIEKIYPESAKIAKQAAKVEVAGYKKGINVADAAVYISPNMFRDLMRMQGKWSPDIKNAFEILTNENTADKWESDPQLYAQANKVILNALKYVAFGTRFNEIPGLGIPYFNKMALFPLFKSIATGDIKALYDRMVDQNSPIDMVMFDSAVKAGSTNPMKFYRSAKDSEIELKDGQTVLSAELTDALESGEGIILNDLNKLHTYSQKFKYLRQQLLTDPHTHEEQMAGTQFMKVNASNIRMNDMYGPNGDQISGQQVKQNIFDSLNALSDKGKLKLESELFTENGDVNITKLGITLLRDARESDANDNVISGLKTKNDAFVIPLSALSDNKWIESRFIATINKDIIDVHMPGGAFIQRSAFGLQATSQSVITENMINDGKPLLSINENGSMDSVVSINLLKHIIPNYSKMTFRQARQWLIDNNIIGQNAQPNAIGYRIPTQSIASISALRFVDVFPEIMGDTIMLPEDFTKLTGSDFDIDKLYVARFSYENGKIVEFDSSISYMDNSENAIKNHLLDTYMKVLLTKDNTNTLKLSIDNATENVKDVLSDIESGRTQKLVEPFEVYTPTYQEARKAEYTGGKAGIGPFALNNAHHILTQLTKLQMASNEFTEALQLTDLGRIFDYPTTGSKKKGRILDWLSAMINGFVDIAKDPYIVRLNVNSWTYNMVSFLLRTGKGSQTFYFVSQPILKEMAEEVLKTKGKYGIDRTKTPSQLEKEAIDKVLDKYDPTRTIRKKYEYTNSKNNIAAQEYSDLFKTYINNDGIETSRTRDMIIHGEVFKNYKEEQIRIYYAWLKLKPYADALANLVKYSKIDTKKTGKTFAEQQQYYNGMWDLANSELFGEGEVKRFYEETFIAHKTENSIPFGTRIFKNLLLRNTDSFLSQKDAVLSLLGRKANANNKLLSSVVSGMEAQIKSQFFNQYIKDNNIDLSQMFSGNYSMAKRLNNFKRRILRGEFEHLLNYDGTFANDFLEFLVPNIDSYNGLDFIDTSDLLNQDQSQVNNLINYWRELIEDPNPRISKLFKDLAVYAFYTSGDNSGMNTFFHLLPNSYRIDIKYTDYIQDKLNYMSNNALLDYNDKTDLFLNNWTNDLMVKPVNFYVGENNTALKSISVSKDALVPNIILGERVGSDKPAIGPVNWIKVKIKDETKSFPIFPPYIKYKDTMGNGIQNWHVYQLIGYKSVPQLNANGKQTGLQQYTPLYGLVEKKGYKYKGHSIVEYGIDNSVFSFNKESIWDYTEALNNKQALLDMVSEYEKPEWSQFMSDIHTISELPSYSNMNYALFQQDSIFMEDQTDEELNGEVLEEKQASDITQNSEKEEYINHSGGAIGSDSMWGTIGAEYGVISKHYYVEGQNTPSGNTAITKQQSLEADEHLMEANKKLNRRFPTSNDYVNGLLRRNWQQVKNSDSIFAIGHISENGTVDGGTGWAVQMAIDNNKTVYVFDQERSNWYKNINGKWSKITTPKLTNNFAGIGTREINSKGIQAIRDVYSLTFSDQRESNDSPINIYFSSNENADLSNFAIRPFRLTQQQADELGTPNLTEEYQSVEQAFQVAKFDYSEDSDYNYNIYQQLMNTTDGARLRKLGRSFEGLNNEWDKNSSRIMKAIIKASFEQNPQAKERLISTGNRLLTHLQDKGKWKTEFPKILMEVRSELNKYDILSLYEQGNERVNYILNQMEDLTSDERQTYLNEFAKYMSDNNVDTQDKLEEALRKFICNL